MSGAAARWRTTTVVLCVLAVLVAGAGAFLGGRALLREIFPCTQQVLEQAEQTGAWLDAALDEADGYEVLTYDCDSGSLPSIALDVPDQERFVAELTATFSCREEAAPSAGEPQMHTCDLPSGSAYVDAEGFVRLVG